MKKGLSVLISLLLLASLLVVPVAAESESEELNFAVASDLHYHAPREALEGDIDDEIYWYANRRAALEDESPYIIQQFLNQVAESGADFVLIPGDLTNDGRPRPEDHYPVAEMLRAFEAETGIPVYVISGNHDTGAGENDTTNAMFKEIYAEFGYNEALTQLISARPIA